jgi:hypothetical protein
MTDILSSAELEAIRQRCEAATVPVVHIPGVMMGPSAVAVSASQADVRSLLAHIAAVMEVMSADGLEAIRRRVEAATAGPWYANVGEMETELTAYGSRSVSWMALCQQPDDAADSFGISTENWEDGIPDDIERTFEFIAHARTDIPHLLAHAAALAGENAALRDELKLWKPMTPEEAEAAYAEAEAVPFSDERIAEIVTKVTDPTYRPTEPERVQMAVKVSKLTGEVERLREALKPFADYAKVLDENQDLDGLRIGYYYASSPTGADCRRAAALLGDQSPTEHTQ